MADDGLYIHFPFCRHKCSYCDFYSVTRLQKPAFLKALQNEISLHSQNPLFGGFSFSTVYFGGGTPSLLTPDEVALVLASLHNAFCISPHAEISLEVNPGTATDQNIAGYRQAGVNRLTIGVQSFDDNDLRFLTRIHDAAAAERTIAAARKTGFENIGIDLIFGIPGQTLDVWRKSVLRACELPVQHISAYGLTYESGTKMTSELQQAKFARCDEELEREMFLSGKEILEGAGFEHYEISNYARPGFRSRHNQKYWDGSRFLGLGPSAFSWDGVRRWSNVADVNSYADSLARGELPIDGMETIDREKQLSELILLGLRTNRGVALSELEEVTEIQSARIIAAVEKRLGRIDLNCPPFQPSPSNSLLCLSDDHIALTIEGLLLYDTICAEMIGTLEQET